MVRFLHFLPPCSGPFSFLEGGGSGGGRGGDGVGGFLHLPGPLPFSFFLFLSVKLCFHFELKVIDSRVYEKQEMKLITVEFQTWICTHQIVELKL